MKGAARGWWFYRTSRQSGGFRARGGSWMSGAISTGGRRWLTLAIVLMSTLIVVLDNTVLNVAIPTILRDFHTTVPALEWVITGYALTFATLLIIGGRLGDLYGTRRMFII